MTKLSHAKRGQPDGRAFVNNGWRPIYEPQQITRGKMKGWFRVVYLAGFSSTGRSKYRYARAIVPEIKQIKS
jgi:hypothetical protein